MADFEAMTTFAAVIRAGSFRGAGLALRVPRSTVSHRVARLEEELGVRLIERTTRRLRPTTVGEEFFKRCVRILTDIEEAHQSAMSAHRAPRGILRVACNLLFAHRSLTKLAADFTGKYPDVEIEIVTSDGRVNLIEEGFDIAIVAMEPSEDSSLMSRKLSTTERRCFASAAYVAERGLPAHPDHVTSHACLVYGNTRRTIWRFERVGESCAVAITGRISANSLMMVHDAAKRGVGIAALPAFMCFEDVREGRLVPVLEDWFIERTNLRIVYPSNRYLEPRVRLFVDALVAAHNQDFDSGTLLPLRG